MTEITAYAPGTFCWAELSTSDARGAKRFYSRLFGWKSNGFPSATNARYTIMQIDGLDVAALYEEESEPSPVSAPSWMTYVAVDDVDATARRAEELGATVILQPFDLLDTGRMAMLRDPQGAVFAVWHGRSHIGAGLVNEPGAICWHELSTSNAESARSFYRRLFNWAEERRTGDDNEYTVFRCGTASAGGMLQVDPLVSGNGAEWLVYFSVDDCDDAVAYARQLGATVLTPPKDVTGVGRFAVLRDPQGAVFAVLTAESEAA
ncbi:MAG: VOC family protein [Thermoanaerobaculia bacterium]